MITEDCIPGASSANAEAANLKSELRSFEALLDDVLRRQSLLISRVDSLHPAPKPGVLDDAAKVLASVVTAIDPLNTWTTVRAIDGRRGTLPFFSPDDDESLITLSNFYAPLESLQEPGLEVEPETTNFPCDSTEKQPATSVLDVQPNAGRLANPATPGKTSIHKSKKRCTSSPLPAERYGKRRRCLSPPEVCGDIGCVPPAFPPATDAGRSSAMGDDVTYLGSFSRLSDPATPVGAEPATPPGSREPQSI